MSKTLPMLFAAIALEPPKNFLGETPAEHLEKINARLAALGKPAVKSSDIIVRPIRLTGNKLTSQYTMFPDAELESFAQQINAQGTAMLSAHMTDDTPLGTFYTAGVTSMPNGDKWLDTWAYWINDDDGVKLAKKIDMGTINEASIGFSCERPICSISGLDWWSSPFYRGQIVQITDPTTGVTTEKMAFVWMFDCQISEGSICYKGSHPDTRVGGTFTSAAQIQLSFSNNAEDAFSKPPSAVQPVPNPILAQLSAAQGEAMNPRILLALGLAASANELEAVIALEKQTEDHKNLLKLTGSPNTAEALAIVNAWKASHNSLAEVVAQRDALQAEQTTNELERLIKEGQDSAKLTTEAQIALARTQTPAALKAMLAVMLPNPMVTQKPVGEPTTAATSLSVLSEDERMIVLQTGVSEKAFLEQKAQIASA